MRMENGTTNHDALAQNARRALEDVCSGAGKVPASTYYDRQFVDHVNDLVFHGLDGAAQSVAMYRAIFSELRIDVEEQVQQGDRVVSRFVVTGVSAGRRVRFHGITISRFENGMIVEDWSVTDTLGMLRQLGLVRSLLAGARSFRALLSAARTAKASTPRTTCNLSGAT
jgi:predicted ester cyclase